MRFDNDGGIGSILNAEKKHMSPFETNRKT